MAEDVKTVAGANLGCDCEGPQVWFQLWRHVGTARKEELLLYLGDACKARLGTLVAAYRLSMPSGGVNFWCTHLYICMYRLIN